jgi:hypothetical protein
MTRYVRDTVHMISVRRRVAILALLASVMLPACFLLSTVDLDLLLRWSDRAAVLPTAQAEYRQILDRIASATNDELLADETNREPRLYRYGQGCVAVQGNRTYGTNRPHADILADYTKVFSTMGWKPGDTRVETKTTTVIVDFEDSRAPDYSTLGKGKYQTIYLVVVVYANPQIFGCFD